MFRKPHLYLFACIIIAFTAHKVDAQIGNLQKYEFHTGFYGGPSQYIGNYNPWWFGSAYEYGNEDVTNTESLSGELNYGAFLSIRLRPRIFLRANMEFGNLRYADEAISYRMSTPYRTTSLNVDFKGNPEGRLRPYLSVGYGTINFRSPLPNEHPEFSEFSPNELHERKVASIIPITFGMQYSINERTALFSEAGFNFTTTDELDNFTPPEDNFSLSNDAFLSLRFGIRVEILKRSHLPMRQPGYDDAIAMELSSYNPQLEVQSPSVIQPAPVDSLIAERRRQQEEIARLEAEEQQRLEEEERRLREAEELALLEEEEVEEEVVERPVIRVVEPEESTFDPEDALEQREEIMEERRRRAELGEIDLSDWDPEVPIIVTTPRPIPGSLVDETGIVTENPPRGYYVQVYASVGPISATNARDLTIRALGDVLEDPERQVIVTMRQQFYEVRIGVFDSYDDTIAVLREIQGTFVDSYTLIYVPRD